MVTLYYKIMIDIVLYKTLYSNYKKKDMDVLLLLSKKKNTFGYNGNGDYVKLTYSNASRLTAKSKSVILKNIYLQDGK